MARYVTVEALQLSDDVKALNPQLGQKPAKEPKTDARKQVEREIRENFARQFESVWNRLGGPTLIKEFKFCAERDWQNDYLHEASKTIIELDGGVWTGGRHVRPQGFINDCIKLNVASLADYRVIRIPTGFATDNYLGQIIEYIQSKESK
jgi:very-short-patch-repair endonuclease